MKKGQKIVLDPRNETLSMRVSKEEKAKLRKAFGSYTAVRNYVVYVAEKMLEGKDDDAKKEKS